MYLAGPTGYASACTVFTARCEHLRLSNLYEPALRATPGCIADKSAHEKRATQGDSLFMAGPTGFEPAISSVTGRRDRPTSLRARVGDSIKYNVPDIKL
jgi:hypothetical protein